VKLVVGLGNPGPRYVGTRHNVGFRIAIAVAESSGLSWQGAHGGQLALAPGRALGVLMPMTWMNASGESVVRAVDALGIAPATELLVAFDDLDLPFGRLRLRAAGGCGGHRGMASIARELASEDFARLRFGIGRPGPGQDVVDYVLEPFSSDEEEDLPAHVDRAGEAIAMWLERGIDAAMERYNRADPAPGSSGAR
jgi:PTH1 family peptidyl-tRNA hydrolase